MDVSEQALGVAIAVSVMSLVLALVGIAKTIMLTESLRTLRIAIDGLQSKTAQLVATPEAVTTQVDLAKSFRDVRFRIQRGIDNHCKTNKELAEVLVAIQDRLDILSDAVDQRVVIEQPAETAEPEPSREALVMAARTGCQEEDAIIFDNVPILLHHENREWKWIDCESAWSLQGPYPLKLILNTAGAKQVWRIVAPFHNRTSVIQTFEPRCVRDAMSFAIQTVYEDLHDTLVQFNA